MAIPVQKLGWFAGILDLRGRLLVKTNQMRATPQFVLMAETRELGIIRELSSLTGTKAEIQKARMLRDFMRRGCTEHCPEAHVHVDDDKRMMPRIARWTITGAGMVTVLENLMPFLMVERGYQDAVDQAYRDTTLVGQGSGAVLASLRRLRDLGWDLPDRYEAALRDTIQDDGHNPGQQASGDPVRVGGVGTGGASQGEEDGTEDK